MTSTISTARGILIDTENGKLVIGLPGTDYRLHLVPTIDAREITTPPGKRIKGEIMAQALKVHRARAGGRFIEPVWGEPRIVQGTVLTVEPHRVLVDVSVPMWVEMTNGQTPEKLEPGEMINFYVRSGTSIRVDRG